MSNEIKVGDKVRVREDAPRVYLRRWDKAVEYDVYAVDGDAAAITYSYQEIAIPLTYLVKVEEEKKEAKFKVGDKVIFIPTGKVKVVSRINANSLYTVTVTEPNGQSPLCVRETELAPYTEPTEEKKSGRITEETANKLSDMLEAHGNAMETIKDKSYWDAYTADLAKEIALKVAKKFNAPHEVAEYAVAVAKAVAEGLKRK